MRYHAFFAALALIVITACSASTRPNRADAQSVAPPARVAVTPKQAADAYYRSAKAAVDRRAEGRAPSRARNIILFVGDGMGVSTVTAARIYAGQSQGVDGESYRLAMETLPHVALSKTYSHDAQVSDSASTATAMLTGIKSRSRTLGLTTAASFGNCPSQAGAGTDTLFELAENAGLATGFVSTTRLTHATPAATFAESASRDWEDDTEVQGDCPDIAVQFIDWPSGDGFEVALAGGRRHFLPSDAADPENNALNGSRGDGRNLIDEWTAKSPDHAVVFDQAGFDAADFASDARILGLFEPSHMRYELDRPGDANGEPSIADMTAAAITRLSRDEDGYVLLVEGGRIDHAHHGTNAARALADAAAFDRAVATALELTDPDETLVIVTADHSHTLTIQGYPGRNNPILGKVLYPTGAVATAADGLPYTTLSYANGASAPCLGATDETADCRRADLSDVDTTARDFQQQVLIPAPSETHAGEDVPVFARGPGAELVSGVMEQNEIFHVMGRASGLVAD